MGDVNVDASVKQVEVQAVVRRADGSVEELGTIAYYHRNPLRRLAWRVKQKITR